MGPNYHTLLFLPHAFFAIPSIRKKCRAVGAAIFGSRDGDFVEIFHLDGYERFTALQSGQVDMLARITTYTMERDLHEVRQSLLRLMLGVWPFHDAGALSDA